MFIAGLFVLAADELAAIAERRGDAAPRPLAVAKPRPRDDCRRRGARLGRRLVPPRVRLLRHRRSARRRTPRARSSSSRRACASWPASALGRRPRRRQRALALASRERLATAARHRAPAARLHALLPGARRDLARTRPGYKENGGIFCHTNPWLMIAETVVGNGDGRARLLPAHQPVGARADLRRPPLRAVRLRPDDRGPRRADPRRGQELVADRHGGLELRGDHPVDPGHPADARRAGQSRPWFPTTGPASAPRVDSGASTTTSTCDDEVPATAVALRVDGKQVEGTVIPLPSAGTTKVTVEALLG